MAFRWDFHSRSIDRYDKRQSVRCKETGWNETRRTSHELGRRGTIPDFFFSRMSMLLKDVKAGAPHAHANQFIESLFILNRKCCLWLACCIHTMMPVLSECGITMHTIRTNHGSTSKHGWPDLVLQARELSWRAQDRPAAG